MRTGRRATIHGVDCVEISIADRRDMIGIETRTTGVRTDLCGLCPHTRGPNRHCDSSCGDREVWVPVTAAVAYAMEE